MDVVAALLLVGLGQGLLLAGLLVLRRDLRSASTLFLAALIAAVTFSGLEDALLRFGWLETSPAFAGLSLVLLPFIGPCLKGHCEAVLNPAWKVEARHWYWFVSIAVGLAFASLFLMQPTSLRLAVLTDRADPQDAEAVTAALAVVVVNVIAAAAIADALITGLCSLRKRSAVVEPTDPLASRLVWLRGLLTLAGLAWIAYAASLLAGLAPGLPTAEIQGVASVVQVAALYGIGLLGLVQPDRMLPPPGEMIAAILAPAGQKYGRSALTEAERQRIAIAITRAMDHDRLYRNPMLNLSRLAAAVGASPNDVSQTLNTAFGVGYHDYISRQRLAEAQQILRDATRRDSLTDVLLEVGFNSKSVFNAAFKRETGMTPSEFRKAAQSRGTAQ